MDTASLIAEFRRLQTGNSRQDFINALVGELDPYEWRTTQNILTARSFQYDIVGRLPVEIVAQVFANLDTSAPYRFQRVSKQWYHILQSPDVLKRSLLSWYGNPSELQRADHSMYKSKAKQAHAFRYGEPTQRLEINLHYGVELVTLLGVTLIWAYRLADQAARLIYLLNLKTWSLQSFNGDARETVVRIFASDQLVGFVTASTVCYVWSRRTQEKRQFRVPGRDFYTSMTCRGSIVAYAGCLKEHALVYVWDYETQKGRSFTISYDCSLFANPTSGCLHKYSITLLLQPKSENIIVFAEGHCPLDRQELRDIREPQPCTRVLRYARYTFGGHHIAESKLVLQGITPPMSSSPLEQLIPVDHEGRYRMNIDLSGKVQFDEQTLAFTGMSPIGDEHNIPEHVSVHWWKGVFFATEYSLGEGKRSMLVHMGTRLRAKDLDVTRYYANGKLVEYVDYFENELIMLSDEFLVRARHSSFEILCFGQHPKIMEQDAPFFNLGSFELIDALAAE